MTFKKLPVCNSVKTINSHYVKLQLDFATLCSIFFSPLVRLWKILSWLRWLDRVLMWRHKKWNLWNNRICQDILKEQHPRDICDISPVMFWWLHTNPSKFVSSPWLHFVVRARKPASFYDEFFSVVVAEASGQIFQSIDVSQFCDLQRPYCVFHNHANS